MYWIIEIGVHIQELSGLDIGFVVIDDWHSNGLVQRCADTLFWVERQRSGPSLSQQGVSIQLSACHCSRWQSDSDIIKLSYRLGTAWNVYSFSENVTRTFWTIFEEHFQIWLCCFCSCYYWCLWSWSSWRWPNSWWRRCRCHFSLGQRRKKR